MKVLIFSQYFWPETFGINAVTRSLKNKGAKITILTGKPNYPEGSVFEGYAAPGIQRENYEGMEVYRLPLIPRGQSSYMGLFLNYVSFIFSACIFGPLVLRGRAFDAVFVYAPSPLLQALPALWLARLKHAPLVLWVQDLWPESLSATGSIKNQWALKLVESVVRFIYRHVDMILIPSEAFRLPIQKLAPVRADIRYYPNAWIEEPDTKNFDGAVEALAQKIAKGFSVVFAGNLGTAQSLETVIRAAELLKKNGSEARFFLIGSGSMLRWVADQIQSKGLNNVEIPGRFPFGAMPRLYSAASALLVSLRDEPIFALTIPCKLQGYLAAGRPIIAALNGEGARIVTEAGAGIACAAANPHALAEAVQALSELSRAERNRMGENARRYAAAHFSLDSLTNELLQHFKELSERHLLQRVEKTQ